MNRNHEEEGGIAILDKPAPGPPPAKKAVVQPPVHTSWGDEDETPTGFKKWRAPLIVGVIAMAGISWAVKTLSKADGSGVRKQSVAMVQLQLPPAPPPPPPPPPPPETMKEEKMIENEKEDEAPPDPTPVVDTAVKGPGAGPIPVASGNRNFLGGRKGGASTKTIWHAYAGQVQSAIASALRGNHRTRHANARVEVRIWANATGRVTRAQLARSTGDQALDSAIRDEILTGLQLHAPPPPGMPMPIVLRVTARRPN
jgi:protein TonB